MNTTAPACYSEYARRLKLSNLDSDASTNVDDALLVNIAAHNIASSNSAKSHNTAESANYAIATCDGTGTAVAVASSASSTGGDGHSGGSKDREDDSGDLHFGLERKNFEKSFEVFGVERLEWR